MGLWDDSTPEALKPVRIILSQAASAALTATGGKVLVMVCKATWPDDPSRWAIHLVPCEMQAATDAIDVATGKARVTKPKPTKKR